MDELRAERYDLIVKCAELRRENDELKAERNSSEALAEGFKRVKDYWKEKVDEVRRERDNFSSQLDAVCQERDELATLVGETSDALELDEDVSHDEVLAAVKELVAGRDAWRNMAVTNLAARDKLQDKLDRLREVFEQVDREWHWTDAKADDLVVILLSAIDDEETKEKS